MDPFEYEGLADSTENRRLDQLEEMFSTHDACTVVADLAKRHWDDPTSLLATAKEADCLNRRARKTRKIAVYYIRFGIGGGEHLLSHAIAVLVNMGYEVVLFTDSEPGPDDYPLPASVERVVIPDFRGMDADGYRQRAQVFQDNLIEHEIDTVLYGLWVCDVLPWDALLIKALGLSLIVYTMSSPSFFFIESDCFLSRLTSVYPLVDTVICLSRSFRCFWRGFCDRVFVSSSPLDNDPSQTAPAPLRGHEILWLGRVSFEKNPGDVIQIMRRVKDAIPDAHLSLVGPVDDEVKASLQASIDSERLTDSITVCGKQEDLGSFYSSSDLLLMTSRYEGFSLSMYDCMASGLPCVTYGLEYLMLVSDNAGCISVPYRDFDAAAQAIVEIFSDDEKKRYMGAAARNRAIEVASFDYESFWKSVFEYTEEGKVTPTSTQEEMGETLELIMDARRIGVSVDTDAFDQLHNQIHELERQTREASVAGTPAGVRFGGIFPEGSRRRECAKKLYKRFRG